MTGNRMIYGCDGAGTLSPRKTALHTRVSPSSTSQPLDSLFLSRSSPSFMGSTSMVSFEDVNGGKRPERPVFRSPEDNNNVVDEELDEYIQQQPGKKRRLTVDQVQFLEKSFEVENKLEPERKSQLAKDLGLQPRQVAIWFQNRRARWKSKQLEKDYDVLHSSYNSLKADYEELIKQKEKLNAEVIHFREKLHLDQKEKTDLDESDTERPSKTPPLQVPADESAFGDEASKDLALAYKPEDKSSKKSDFLNGDSPRYTGGHSSLLEAGDTSYVFEPDQSDLSQDEEDNFSKSMLSPFQYVFPKMELDDYSGHYAFPVDDQAPEFWPY